MAVAEDKKYQIGNFFIDTARYRISSGDTIVPVEPKVFDLLVYLIRHRDRVLSREELFQMVWNGREVSDATLSNHVKNARKALGDNGELQQTIATIRGRGYQFIAPVSCAVDDAVDAGSLQPPESLIINSGVSPKRNWRSPVLLLIAALLVPLVWFGSRLLIVSPTQAESNRPYILVLPFGVSANATEYHRTFADHLTREVISNLRKLSGLRTVPHASAFQFRSDKTAEHILKRIPEIQFVLEGEVSVAPDGTLRISPRFTDLRKDLDVWNSAFTVRVNDQNFFETPVEIAKAVATALKIEIVKDEQRALAELPSNPQAYEPYVAGWREMDLFTHESLQRASTYFDQAIQLDPNFLAAYLAKSEALRSIFAYFESPQALLPIVEASLKAVLARDPNSAEALSSLGLTQVMAWQWQPAWENLNRAKALDRSLTQTELGFALYYSAIGENEKVKASLARASELDPLNTELADWGNWALFMVGEQQASREWTERQMRQHPDNGFVFCGAGIAAYLRGDEDEAVELLEKGVELTERAPVALLMLAQGYGYAGQKDKVLPLLEEAEQAKIYMCPYETAAAYLSLDDEVSRAKAMDLLFDAVNNRSNCLIFLRNDPRMKVLREDPQHADRFEHLLTLVGLDDASVRSHKK